MNNPQQEEANKAVVRRFNKEVIEGHRSELLPELFAPDFVNWSAKAGLPPGLESMTGVLEQLWEALSGLRVEIHAQIAEGDRVATRKTIHGRHTGTLLSRPPTGREVALPVIDIVRLEQGRYREHWNLIDLSQLEAAAANPAPR